MQGDVHILSPRAQLHTVYDERFKSEILSFHYLMPFVAQDAALYQILPNVLKAGCRSYPDEGAIARRLEELYGADISHCIIRRGNMIEYIYTLEMLCPRYTLYGEDLWDAGTALMTAILYEPLLEDASFPAFTVKREANEHVRVIRDRYNYKELLARDLARKAVCGDDPYGESMSGTYRQAKSATAEELMRVYRAFLDDSIVHIYYCGARPKQQLLDFSRRIAAFHPTAPRAMIDYPSLPMVSRVKRRARAAHVRQSQVVCAYQIDLGQKDPLWAHLSIFDAVLSASPKAKLFSQVREKLSLCYSCYGIADRIGRIYYITAGVEPGSEQEAIREIHSVVQEMQSGKIRVEELRDAQNHLLYGYASMSDMPDAYETWYFHNLFTGGFTDLTKSMEFTGHETVDDITAFASHLHLAAEVVIRGVDESGEVTP